LGGNTIREAEFFAKDAVDLSDDVRGQRFGSEENAAALAAGGGVGVEEMVVEVRGSDGEKERRREGER
jgi:hypothetical protein